MKKILIAFVFLSLISLASASSNLGTFKSGECVDIYQSCDNCTYVNLTSITYPNSTVLKLDQEMTKNGVDYNYSFCQTYPTGTYKYNVCGDKDGGFKCEDIVFIVNPTGVEQESVLSNSALIIFGALAILLIFAGIYFSASALGFMGAILFMLLGVYTTIYGFNNVTDFYTRAMGITVIGLGFIFMFASAYEWFKSSEE